MVMDAEWSRAQEYSSEILGSVKMLPTETSERLWSPETLPTEAEYSVMHCHWAILCQELSSFIAVDRAVLVQYCIRRGRKRAESDIAQPCGPRTSHLSDARVSQSTNQV